jgi:predicted RNase H-like HicB family nuclease
VTTNRYAIVVFWSEEDRAWIADVPDLKSCTAFGDTPEEAFAEVRVAMDAWLAAAREAGMEIPEPHFQPHHEAAE